jgi:hypothetical protein
VRFEAALDEPVFSEEAAGFRDPSFTALVKHELGKVPRNDP